MFKRIMKISLLLIITLMMVLYTPRIIEGKNGENLIKKEIETIASDILSGDVNGDGKVNNKDFTRLFQYIAGWDVEVNYSAFDTNGDGKVNNKDITRLFQYLAGWEVELHINTHTHNMVEESKVEATCTTDGYTKYKCDGCLYNYIGDYIYALGHEYGEWNVEKLASCYEDGLQYNNCIHCDKKITRIVQSISHSYLLIEETELIKKYECEHCGDIIDVDAKIENIDLGGNEQLIDQEDTFSFIVKTNQGIDYVYENLIIFNSYYEGTGYETADEIIQPFIVEPLSNIYTLSDGYTEEELNNSYIIITEQPYEVGMTYKAKLLNEGKDIEFAEYSGKELTYSIKQSETSDIVFKENVKFLKFLEENNPGYYPYSLNMSDESEYIYLIINKVDEINIGDILLIGDVIDVEEFKETTEEIFIGKVEKILINEENKYVCILSAPELKEVFEKLNVFTKNQVNFEEFPELEETLEEESLACLYDSEDFAEFIAATDQTAQAYALERNIVATPLTKENFTDKIKIEKPILTINGTKATVAFKGSFLNEFKDINGEEIGSFSVEFSITLELELEVEANIKLRWFLFIPTGLEQFDIKVIQKDKFDIDFEIKFEIDYELYSKSEEETSEFENYYYHRTHKKIHVKGCTYQKMTDYDNIIYIKDKELNEYANKEGFTTCLKCQPVDKLNRTSFIINMHLGTNEPYTIHCCDCWHVEQQMKDENKLVFNGTYEALIKKFKKEKQEYDSCSWCQPYKKEKLNLEKELNKAYEYSDWGEKTSEIKQWAKSSGGSEYDDSKGIDIGNYSYMIYGITLNVDLKLVLSFEFEATFNYHYEQVHENIYGMRKQNDRIVTYKDCLKDESGSTLELKGKMEFQVGLRVDGYVSIVGLSRWIRLGFNLEVGPYIELQGVIRLSDKEVENNIAAAKLSTGLYLKVSVYYKALILGGEFSILDEKFPFATWGYDRVYYSYTDSLEKMYINGNTKLDLDTLLAVKYYDIVNMDSVDEVLSLESSLYDINLTFKYGEYCTVDDLTGEIKINQDAPCKFKDIIIIEVLGNTEWNEYKKGSSLIYLDTRTVEIFYQEDGEHNYVVLEENDSTCTEEGYRTYYCTICDLEQIRDPIYEVIPASHKIVNDKFLAPTCTETGLTDGSHCSLCSEVFEEVKVIPSLGHDLINHEGQVATCLESGWESYETCERCDHNTYIEIPALGHTEVVDKAVDATCTKTGLTEGKHCSVCDEVLVEQTVIEALGHVEVIDESVSPTCTETGLTEGKHCSVCDEVLIAQEVVKVLGHTEVVDEAVAPTCTTTGLTEGKHCSVCNEVLVVQTELTMKEHNFDGNKCINCEYLVQSEGLIYTLNSDNISYSLTGIGSCTDVNVIIPKEYNDLSVTGIGNDVFENNTNIVSVEIPNSVTSIGKGAFYRCTSLTAVYYNGTLEDWCNITFSSTSSNPMYSATNFYMLDENNEWYEVTEIVIPDSITSIGKYQLSGFDNVSKITILNSVTSIDSYAFFMTYMTDIYLPNSIKTIAQNAFSATGPLNNLYYSGTIEDWCNIEFSNSLSNPMWHAEHFYMLDQNAEYCEVTEIVIPDTITSIGNYQFYGFDNLIKIEIPYIVMTIGENVFENCTKLTIYCEIEAKPDGWSDNWNSSNCLVVWEHCIHVVSEWIIDLEQTCTEDGHKYKECTKCNLILKEEIITAIGHYYVDGKCTICQNIKTSEGLEFTLNTDNISYSLKGIGSCADEMIIIPREYNNLPVIGVSSSAFENCIQLKKVIIPKSVTSIGDSAFSNCTNLKEVYYNGTIEDWCNIAFTSGHSNPMYYASNFYMLDENNEYYEVTEIEIPDTITSIRNCQFLGFDNLTKLTIPNTVTSIENFSFGMTGMTDIYLPNSIISIGLGAFYDCPNLESIIIPNSVTSIGQAAFYNCTNLTDVYYNGTIEDWCNITFNDEYSNSMYYAKKIYMLDKNNEYYEVTEVIIPDTVTSIGKYQLSGFDNITKVIIPNSVTSIGYYAFYNCTNLTIYCESVSQPSGWNTYWNSSNCPVVWNYTNNLTIEVYIDNGKSYINLGKYPQTVVDDEELISELDKISMTNSLGYIEYEGVEYKKQVAIPNYPNYSFENGNIVNDGQVYYFKVEPIKWRVLETTAGGFKLLSEYLLDTKPFYISPDNRTINGQTIYANNYEYSTIRAWLNGYDGTSFDVYDYEGIGFIDIAFNELEKTLIKTTFVDNSIETTGYESNSYVCNNTNDKIYLLSYKDLNNESFGFSSDLERQTKVTDFALAKSCWLSTDSSYYRNGVWELRSPDDCYSHYVRIIDPNGYINTNGGVYYDNVGIRMALEISI